MNHSTRFWRQVERCVPTWKDARRWLEERGSALHAVGDV
jgi:predicted metal-dependent hydrolase